MDLRKLSPGLRRIHQEHGMAAKLAAHLGLTRQAVHNWRKVPFRHLIAVEAFTGIPREDLRPDIFRLLRKPGRKRA